MTHLRRDSSFFLCLLLAACSASTRGGRGGGGGGGAGGKAGGDAEGAGAGEGDGEGAGLAEEGAVAGDEGGSEGGGEGGGEGEAQGGEGEGHEGGVGEGQEAGERDEGGQGDEGGEGGEGGEGEGAEGEGVPPDCEPVREICDGRDNDCDREVDEDDPDLGEACDTGEPGPCWQGRRRCVEGGLECVGVVDAQDEICDGIDNDCDGDFDEGEPESGERCDAAVPGECGFGLTRCAEGFLWCDGVDPQEEVCDGLDNDCDGAIDEELNAEPAECDTGEEGVCGVGVALCDQGDPLCEQVDFPDEEQCDDADNDCDGEVDEDLECGPECDAIAQDVCWMKTLVPRETHAAACGRVGLQPTGREVLMPWNNDTLQDIADQIGCNNIGDYNNSAKSMWVEIASGDCGTHNFGDR